MTKILASSIHDLLDHFADVKGPVLSVYLPFGISGVEGNRAGIERKNTLALAARKVKGQKWRKKLKAIEQHMNSQPKIELGETTLIYLADSENIYFTSLPAQIKPHFSFADFAEIEPLVYYRWASDYFEVLVLDLNEPKLMRGFGPHIFTATVNIEDPLRSLYGVDFSAYSLKHLIEIGDRRREGRTDLDRSKSPAGKPGGYHGFSSRQQSERNKDIDYWLRIVGPILKENIRTCDLRFLAAEQNVANIFSERFSEVELYTKTAFPLSLVDDPKKLAKRIQKTTLDRKLAESLENLAEIQTTQDVAEIIDLLETGRIKKLFVEQRDTMIEDNKQESDYEYQNPRSNLICKALNCHADIQYVRSTLDNKPGLAAVGY